MNKILVVVVLGGILLALFLVLQGRKAGEATTASVAAPSTGIANAVATTPATAAAPPPSVSDTTACARLAELCSTSDHAVDTSHCEKQLVDARKMYGEANVLRSEQCLGEAKTCAAATGCISGGMGMGAMGEFLKGLGNAMSH
jgi:hypothetical protein